MTKRRAAVKVAAELNDKDSDLVTMSTGVMVKINPVPPTLIDAVQANIQDPKPPEVFIEEKGRSEPNPLDPGYLRAMERANTDRVLAGVDALILFGVTLVDEDGNKASPPDDGWLEKLQLLERFGSLDLSGLDLDNPLDIEFAYKRYVALGATDIALVASRSGLTEGDVAAAEEIFRD